MSELSPGHLPHSPEFGITRDTEAGVAYVQAAGFENIRILPLGDTTSPLAKAALDLAWRQHSLVGHVVDPELAIGDGQLNRPTDPSDADRRTHLVVALGGTLITASTSLELPNADGTASLSTVHRLLQAFGEDGAGMPFMDDRTAEIGQIVTVGGRQAMDQLPVIIAAIQATRALGYEHLVCSGEERPGASAPRFRRVYGLVEGDYAHVPGTPTGIMHTIMTEGAYPVPAMTRINSPGLRDDIDLTSYHAPTDHMLEGLRRYAIASKKGYLKQVATLCSSLIDLGEGLL